MMKIVGLKRKSRIPTSAAQLMATFLLLKDMNFFLEFSNNKGVLSPTV